jgi:hypothetical protein
VGPTIRQPTAATRHIVQIIFPQKKKTHRSLSAQPPIFPVQFQSDLGHRLLPPLPTCSALLPPPLPLPQGTLDPAEQPPHDPHGVALQFARNGIRRRLSRRRPRRRAARRTADLAPPLAAATGVVYSGPAALLLALCLPFFLCVCVTPFDVDAWNLVRWLIGSQGVRGEEFWVRGESEVLKSTK